ncbi:MAG: hypothetical protein WCT14_09160 [Treponemataceae bacterium]
MTRPSLIILFIAVFAAIFLRQTGAQTTGQAVPNKTSIPATPSVSVPSAAETIPVITAPAFELSRSDPSVWLGATLDQILRSFGAPQSVHTVRGPEPWQDDVVFVYDTVELYWFTDRVWQVRCNAAYGLRAGDSKESVVSALGEPLQRFESDFVYQRPSRAWPLRLRLKFGETNGVTDFYIYRADF